MKTNLKVESIKDGIVVVAGSYNYRNKEIIEFENKDSGLVLRANKKKAWVAMIENNLNDPVRIGQSINPLGREYFVDIYDNIFGSIIDIKGNHLIEPLYKTEGNLIDSKTTFLTARPIYTRDTVDTPLKTGTLAIDGIIPIGKGQRELIIGDRQTGKTSIAFNMIYNQAKTEVKSIYVAIGKKRSEIVFLHDKLRKRGLLDQVLILSADADTTSISKYLAPYAATTIAEFYQKRGEDILIIYDDLTSHADAYREVSLLTGAAPGRDAYPGDIFYQHSRLLERAGKYNFQVGGGSITAIPIVETQAGDISGYIPTNVISITDGQIFTSKDIFNKGIKPAIDIPYSVSRISTSAQSPAMQKVSGGLKLLVSQFKEFEKVATFSSSMAEENISIITRGKILENLLKQTNEELINYEAGIILLALLKEGYLDFYADEKNTSLQVVKNVILKFLKNDILGQKLMKALKSPRVKNIKLINSYITHLILPLIKFHLVSTYEIIKLNQKFIDKYDDIRNDGRIIWNQMVKGMKEGVVYDYDLY